MSVEEVGVRRVYVARLHRHYIGHNRYGRHDRLEEIHNTAVEALTQRRISTEGLPKCPQSQKTDWAHNDQAQRTIFASS